MSSISGIGKASRVKLGKVITHCKSGLIDPDQVVEALQVTKVRAYKLLEYWEKKVGCIGFVEDYISQYQ